MYQKKNIIYICVIVLGLGYAGYSLFLSGNSAQADSGISTLVKKQRATDSSTVQGVIKKSPRGVVNKKDGFTKKTVKSTKKSIKKKPGRRGNKKTKKKEISPSV